MKELQKYHLLDQQPLGRYLNLLKMNIMAVCVCVRVIVIIPLSMCLCLCVCVCVCVLPLDLREYKISLCIQAFDDGTRCERLEIQRFCCKMYRSEDIAVLMALLSFAILNC